MTDSRRTRLEEQRDQALTDLLDIEAQVASGEIPREVAALMRTRSEAAAANAMKALDRLDPLAPTGRSRRRIWIGIGGFILAVAVITITVVSAVEPRPAGGFVTGGVASDVIREGATDLSSVTNEEMEQVVAANPEILPMRLALARRYVEAGDFSAALPHYLFVLDRETDPQALMYVGWMTYLSGDAETGVALLHKSLEIVPEELLAQWFIANALFYGTGDRLEAIPFLEAIIESGVAPDDVVTEARQMLSEANQ